MPISETQCSKTERAKKFPYWTTTCYRKELTEVETLKKSQTNRINLYLFGISVSIHTRVAYPSCLGAILLERFSPKVLENVWNLEATLMKYGGPPKIELDDAPSIVSEMISLICDKHWNRLSEYSYIHFSRYTSTDWTRSPDWPKITECPHKSSCTRPFMRNTGPMFMRNNQATFATMQGLYVLLGSSCSLETSTAY